MKYNKQRVCLSLDSDLVEILKTYAENEDRSLSQYVNRLLKFTIASPPKKTVPGEDSPFR